KVGALSCLNKPVSAEGLREALGRIKDFVDRRVKSLLIVEDDDVQRNALIELTKAEDIETTAAGTGAEALKALGERKFDCMILDLMLSDISGFDLLETISRDESLKRLPVIVYTGKELAHREKLK